MSRGKPPPKSGPVCWDCGATNDPGASECWLCQRRDWRGPPRLPTSSKPQPSPRSDREPGLIGLVLGLVALGGVLIAPGLVIGLLIIILPAWGIAERIAHRRWNRGLPTSTTEKVVWIVGLTILMPILLGMALFIAATLVCLVTGPPTFH